jgi:enediyne biosynthesis thioesterase
VSFEDTNLVGNVYFVSHVRWQGRCREMFLREHAPDVLADLADGLALATTRVSCQYFAELRPFEEVAIRMRLEELTPSRITMSFEYWRLGPVEDELVARGEQQVACMRRGRDGTVTVATVPETLKEALQAYT